jgi:hypothetical protein
MRRATRSLGSLGIVIFRQAWIPSILLSLFAWMLVRPVGEFPVNDDWQYARAAKILLDSGKFVSDSNSAAALLGQVIASWPILKIFGFSHLTLRFSTIALSLLCLVCIDRILARAKAAPWARIAATCTLAVSPYWLYLSGSYMTELWGLAPALLAAAIWFTYRRDSGAIVAVPAALTCGLLCAVAFCTRQFCMLALPALFISAMPALHGRLRASLPALLTASASCAVVIALWFLSRSTQIPEALRGHEANLRTPHLGAVGVQCCFFVFYMSGFMMPLLLLFPFRSDRITWRLVPLFLLVALLAGLLARLTGDTPAGVCSLTHTRFPYMGNILYDAGLGPITTADLFVFNAPPPGQWGAHVWRWIEWTIGLSAALWATVRIRRAGLEVALFGTSFGALSTLVAAQATAPYFFERYNINGVVGLAIALGAAFPLQVPQLRKWACAVLPALLLATFSIGAMHDHFRWQRARTDLAITALEFGADRSTVEMGYELDGWLKHQEQPPPASHCINHCSCDWVPGSWNCQDSSYYIGFSPPPHYGLFTRVKPSAWLVDLPYLLLAKRNPK